MKNITELFYDVYKPQKAIIFFECCKHKDSSIYIEAYDMDERGKPVNGRPLSIEECGKLAEMMHGSIELQATFLQAKGILPDKVLHVNTSEGYAVWHTPEQSVNMFFKDSLGINNGKTIVPPMIWKACKDSLYVYAVKEKGRPNRKTKLFDAPFFNIHSDGQVCMGTVDIEIGKNCCLEDFISQWEHYFWNSKFSHLINSFSPVQGNIVLLWQEQVGNGKPFPMEVLKKTDKTLKDLIVWKQEE